METLLRRHKMINLAKIEFVRAGRNKKYLIMSIGMPVVFYLIFTALLKLPNIEAQRLFMKEYLMSMTVFSLSSFSLFTFPVEIIEDKKNGWRNLLYRLPISVKDIYIVKLFKMVIYFFVSIVLVFLVGYLIRGVQLTITQWVVSGLLLLFGATVFLSLGTILSNFKDEKTSSIFGNLLFLGLAMVGGLWFPTNQFPEWLQTVSKLTPTYHFRELAVGYITSGEIPLKSILVMIIYGLIFISISILISKKKKEDIA